MTVAGLIVPFRTLAHRSTLPSARGALGAALLAVLCLGPAPQALAEKLGDVPTVFHLTGDDTIQVDAYDDPKVQGITCYVSRARTGRMAGRLGLAEDKSEASIACRQTGPIQFSGPLPHQEDVFTERLSILFKRLHVVRLVDSKRNTLVYMTYSDRLIEGSPKNSVTAVAVDRSTPIPSR